MQTAPSLVFTPLRSGTEALAIEKTGRTGFSMAMFSHSPSLFESRKTRTSFFRCSMTACGEELSRTHTSRTQKLRPALVRPCAISVAWLRPDPVRCAGRCAVDRTAHTALDCGDVTRRSLALRRTITTDEPNIAVIREVKRSTKVRIDFLIFL